MITGTTSGLGLELAKVLSSTAVKLVQFNRSPQNAPSFPESISQQLDLSNVNEVDLEFINKFCESLTKYDELVFIINAAEIQPLATVMEMLMRELESTFSTNFFGYVACLKTLLAQQARVGFKLRILNITTGAADNNHAGWAAYSISKLAIQRYCQFLILENPTVSLKEYNPGVFESPMQENIRLFYNNSSETSTLRPASEIANNIANLVLLNWEEEQ